MRQLHVFRRNISSDPCRLLLHMLAGLLELTCISTCVEGKEQSHDDALLG